jgi:hypothetical protein
MLVFTWMNSGRGESDQIDGVALAFHGGALDLFVPDYGWRMLLLLLLRNPRVHV